MLVPASLRGRLTLAVGISSVLVALSSSTLVYVLVTRQSDAELTRDLTTRIDRIASRNSTDPFPRSESFAQIIQFASAGGRRVPLVRSVPANEPLVLTAAELGAVSPSGLITAKRIDTLEGPTRVLAQRRRMNDRESIIIVGSPLRALDLQKARTSASLILGAPFLAGLLTLGGWLIVGAALRPVRRMTDEAAAISSADSRRRLPLPKRQDEIAHLGGTLNAMLDRIEASFERERRFVDDASHELRTPLGIMRAEVELALMELNMAQPKEASAEGALRSLLDEIDRLGALADDLLALSKSRPVNDAEVERPDTEVFAITTRAVDRLKPVLPRLGTSSPKIEVRGGVAYAAIRAEDYERIVNNLVSNATKFAKERVLVEVSAEHGRVVLIVADDGPGFPPELLPHAFERFRVANPARTRTHPLKRTRSGTGLGLAIVRSVAEAADGTAHAANGAPFGGARVEVDLPAAVRPFEAEAKPHQT